MVKRRGTLPSRRASDQAHAARTGNEASQEKDRLADRLAHRMFVSRRTNQHHANSHVEGAEEFVIGQSARLGKEGEKRGHRPRRAVDLRRAIVRKHAREIVEKAMQIAGNMCIYTNHTFVFEELA